ncbi:MAG TPA: hypothetical protein DCF44_09765, partial [Chitinophagaceae bacterium]|nr:hypothetical protein [Chitinophagaceae bacterium]
MIVKLFRKTQFFSANPVFYPSIPLLFASSGVESRGSVAKTRFLGGRAGFSFIVLPALAGPGYPLQSLPHLSCAVMNLLYFPYGDRCKSHLAKKFK